MRTHNEITILPKIEVVKDRKRKKERKKKTTLPNSTTTLYPCEPLLLGKHSFPSFVYPIIFTWQSSREKNYVAFSRRLVTYSGTTL